MSAKVLAPPLAPIDLNQSYPVLESCAYLRCSRTSFYRMLGEELFEVVRRNGRPYTPGTELARLAQLPSKRTSTLMSSDAAPRRGRGRPRESARAK
jgi:hypothetical protein